MNAIKNKLINVFILSFSLFLTILLVVQADNFTRMEPDATNYDNTYVDVNITEVIAEYNKKNTVVSQNQNDLFISLITVTEDYSHETILINSKTGNEMHFEDIIFENRLKDFWEKVYELLSLKYPKFIVDGIKSQSGNIYYEIKENEMVIYFEQYIFVEQINDIISIKINYNEVKDLLNFPHKLDLKYENENAYNYDKNKKSIAITFDDGPNSNYTKKIVDVLNENKAKATFFMVGNKMYNHRENLLYVFNNGFEIGSHTYSHINMKRELERVSKEIKATNDIFYDITASSLSLVRPPYGAYNDKVLEKLNKPLITWNIDTNDWRYHDVEYIVNHIMDNVTDGSIILMHDSYESSLEALKLVLPKLYAKGYQVVTVSDLAALKGVILENNKVYSHFN